MADRLNGVAAVVSVDGKIVTVDRSTDLASLNAATIKALRKADALVSMDEKPEAEADESPFDLAAATDDQLLAWVGKAKVADILQAVGDDQAQRDRVVAAESVADKPRKSLMDLAASPAE